MTAEQFRAALPKSPIEASKRLGVPPEQIRKWSMGEEPIPAFVISLIGN